MKGKLIRLAAALSAVLALGPTAAFAQSAPDLRPPAPTSVVQPDYLNSNSCATPGPVIYLTDDQGRLGTLTLGTYKVHVIGNEGVVLTDLGFDPKNHQLYGISFSALYSVNKSTGRATYIGSLGISDANALVFDANGNAYTAGVNVGELYKINLSTGGLTRIGSMSPYRSAGDLTFYNNGLVLAGYDQSSLGATTPDTLVLLDLKTGKPLGKAPLTLANLFGIVSTGSNLLFGFAQTSVYQLFPTESDINKRAIRLNAFGGKGLSNINGAAYDGAYQN